MQLKRKRVRLSVEITAGSGSQIKDAKTGATPELWRGNDVQFELGLFYDNELIDISNLNSITLEVVEQDERTGTRLMSKTVTWEALAEDSDAKLDGTLDLTAWNGNTAQHAMLPFASNETNLDLGGNDKTYWMVISTVTDQGFNWTLGYALLKIVEDGHGEGGTPPVLDPNYYTKDESSALFVKKSDPALELQSVKVWNADQGRFVEFVCRGAAGAEELASLEGS